MELRGDDVEPGRRDRAARHVQVLVPLPQSDEDEGRRLIVASTEFLRALVKALIPAPLTIWPEFKSLTGKADTVNRSHERSER
jgi:hypothetical protein